LIGMLFQRDPGWASDWRAPARERMNSRRPDGKLEAGLAFPWRSLRDSLDIFHRAPATKALVSKWFRQRHGIFIRASSRGRRNAFRFPV